MISCCDEEEKLPSRLAHHFTTVEDQHRMRKEGRHRESALVWSPQAWRHVLKDAEELEGFSRIFKEFLFQMLRLTPHCVHVMTLVNNADCCLFYCWDDFLQLPMLPIPDLFATHFPPCCVSFPLPKFACWSLLRCGPSSGCQRSGDFLVWGSALPFSFFIVLYFGFFGDSLVSGSVLTALWHIALLEGVCWNSGSCVSMCNAPDTWF